MPAKLPSIKNLAAPVPFTPNPQLNGSRRPTAAAVAVINLAQPQPHKALRKK
jgi:hypothetical protein